MFPKRSFDVDVFVVIEVEVDVHPAFLVRLRLARVQLEPPSAVLEANYARFLQNDSRRISVYRSEA